MALVEETARYLDGKGREESRDLPRKIAMLYAGESMRVTTRLMQAASWLLVQRAVHDGDMEARRCGERTLSAGLDGNLPGRQRRRHRTAAGASCRICWSAATISIAASRGWTMSCSARRSAAARTARSTPGAGFRQQSDRRNKNAAGNRRRFVSGAEALGLHEAGEFLVEARQAAAAVHQLLLAAGPGRVGGRVDVQRHLLARRRPRWCASCRSCRRSAERRRSDSRGGCPFS